MLTVLDLPADPDALLAQHVQTLEEAYIYVGGRLIANTDVQVDAAGKIHVSTDKAIEDPPSLIDLRKRVAAMLPRVDIGEAILEVMGWVPQFMDSLTALSRGQSRLADLDITVAACLTGQALNIGYGPIAAKGVPALERRRMGHITATYLRAENYTAANPHLVARQAGIDFAQRLGGGLVAAIDGMRFVVPVPSLLARPNRKYFGPKRGMTFLNMINDQAFGTSHKIVAGTDRDCLHAIDLFFNSGTGNLPEVLITDTGSYSDLVFGIAQLLGVEYRPALADLPDQKGWRTRTEVDYGPLNTFARGRLDLGKVRRHWDDILRLIASIYTGKVTAYDVVKALQRDGHPTALGEALAIYGRIFKTLHILSVIDSEPYRRGIKGMRNLQEGRHALAEKVFHGPQARAVPALPRGHGRPARGPGHRLELPGPVDHRLHRRRTDPAARPGLPRARRGRRTPEPVHESPLQRPREILLHRPGPAQQRHPHPARPGRTHRGRGRVGRGEQVAGPGPAGQGPASSAR